jgi:hypothetical protein
MQYPTTTDIANLYPVPPVTGFPAAENFGDYTFYNGTDWVTGDTKISLGGFAGQTNQGNNATALGYFAGTTNQGEESVAIGHNAGNLNQANNTIILNATGDPLNGISGQTGSFFVDPIRYYGNEAVFAPLGYNLTTKEVGWSLAKCGIYTCVAGSSQVIPIPGLTANGIVLLTYVHPNSGGAGQWISSVTPTTNALAVQLGQAAATNETIIWIVGRL